MSSVILMDDFEKSILDKLESLLYGMSRKSYYTIYRYLDEFFAQLKYNWHTHIIPFQRETQFELLLKQLLTIKI